MLFLMLFIVLFCSCDLSFGCPCFMRPKSLLSSICFFSASSKAISPLCMLLKVCNGPLNLEKLIEGILKSLKLYVKS